MSKPSEGVLAWAAVGSRISGFHHDSASKLQSLMMALDEAAELAADRPDVARSLQTAMASLKDLHGLLTENRALAKAPVRKDSPLAEIVHKATGRHGVKLKSPVAPAMVHVATPSITHALSLLADVLAGPVKGSRTIEAIVTPGETVMLVLTGVPPAESALDAITIATFLIEREGGAVFSAPSGFHVQLPTKP
jgi:hypothetical protein